MKAKLIINNQEIEVEISEEEYKKLQTTEKKETGYERVENGDMSYYVDWKGKVVSDIDEHDDLDNITYEAANYYSDWNVAENNARADKLMRQLRRFAVEHREKELDWMNECQDKWRIHFEHYGGPADCLRCTTSQTSQFYGIVYFDTEETAQLAIDTFRDELIWYFTEYKDSL